MKLKRTFCGACLLSLFAIGPLAFSKLAMAQAQDASADATYNQGIAAAKSGQYSDAIKYLSDVYTKEPARSDVWLYLGLAQARTPGHEIRAIAWLQAYLLANPNAPNVSAIHSQITLLEESFESRTGRILDELETAIPKGSMVEAAPDANDLQAAVAGYDARSAGELIAASRLFLGDTQESVRVLNETNGRHWNDGSDNSFASVITGFVSAPSVPVASSIVRNGISRDNSGFILESASPADAYAEVAAHWNNVDGWRALACTEHARSNTAVSSQVLDKYWAAVQDENKKHPNSEGYYDQSLVETVGYLGLFQRNDDARKLLPYISKDYYKKQAEDLISGATKNESCAAPAYWWSSGRIAFLTFLGINGRDPASYQKTPNLDQEVFSQAYVEKKGDLVSNAITVRMQAVEVVGGQVASLSQLYREIRGPYAPTAWPSERFESGLGAEKRQQWPSALRSFLQSLEGDPKRPETLLHLGMVSAQIPGREYRGVAFLKAYLALVPQTPQRTEVEQTISKLLGTIQMNLGKNVDELARAVESDKTYGWCKWPLIATQQALAGFGDQAMKTNRMKTSNKMCGSSVSPGLMSALALGGDVAAARQAYEQNPPAFSGTDDDVLRSEGYFDGYDNLLGAFLDSGSIKDGEALYPVMMKHSALTGNSLPQLACREFRSGNVASAADILKNLRDTAVAGATPAQQDQLAVFLGHIARMQVLMQDTPAAQATLAQIKYPDKRKEQADYAMAPKAEVNVDLERIFWLIFGNGYGYVFSSLPAEECWFPEARANILTDFAVKGFYIYAKDGSGAGKCMDTNAAQCIETSKAAPRSSGDTSWDHWKNSVDALLTAYDFLHSQ